MLVKPILEVSKIPPMKENAVPMAGAQPDIVPTAVPTTEQPLRRSKFLNDYALY